MNFRDPDLTITVRGNRVTATRGDESVTVAAWAAGFLYYCTIEKNAERRQELWDHFIRGPSDLIEIMDFVEIVYDISHETLEEFLKEFLSRPEYRIQ